MKNIQVKNFVPVTNNLMSHMRVIHKNEKKKKKT